MSTLERRPALGLNTWDKVALQCPRPWRGLSNSAVSSMECLKHQGNMSLKFWYLAPTPEERPITAVSYRPQGVWKRQALGRLEAPQGVAPSMVFPSHGYRGVTLLTTDDFLGDVYLGDAFSWDAWCVPLTLALTLTLTLTSVNARGRDVCLSTFLFH